MSGPPAQGVKRDCRCTRARHQHGTRAAYDQDKCRCRECWHARKLAKHHGAGWRDANSMRLRIGVIRRIEALHSLGWSGQQLAQRIGVTKDALNNIRVWPTPDVYAGTYARICALYDELWDQQPSAATRSERISVAKTRGWARRQGFVPPLAWDDATIDDPAATPAVDADVVDDDMDEVEIERIMAGAIHVPLNTKRAAELVEAVRRLAAAGHPDAFIGRRVGRTVHAVLKIRERNNIPPGVQPSRPDQREDTAA